MAVFFFTRLPRGESLAAMASLPSLVWVLALCAAIFGGCKRTPAEKGEIIITPPEAHIDLSALPGEEDFSSDDQRALFRYLATNPRWDVREERGLLYAVRLEGLVNPPVKEQEGAFLPTLWGHYSLPDPAHSQHRILITFGKPMAEGAEVTSAKAGEKEVPLKILSPEDKSNGNQTWLDVTFGAKSADDRPVRIEIFEQSWDHKRPLTKTMIADLASELDAVKQHRDELLRTGVMPDAEWYPVPMPQAAKFEVMDHAQPGIYIIDAAVNPKIAGRTYVRAFDTKTGARLSEERLTPRSMRHIGYSEEAGKFFRYTSEFTIYEGDWNHQYEARFELWLRPDSGGAEEKLAETTRMINGWQP